MDLLEHEVREASLLDLVERKRERVHLLRERDVVDRTDFESVATQHGQLAVPEIDHLLGVGDDRGRVGGHERLPLPHADDQGRALSRRVEAVGLVSIEDHEAVGAGDLFQGEPNCRLEGQGGIGRGDLLDEVSDHLGVGLAVEGAALRLEHGLEGGVVLDDAVVYQRDGAG